MNFIDEKIKEFYETLTDRIDEENEYYDSQFAGTQPKQVESFIRDMFAKYESNSQVIPKIAEVKTGYIKSVIALAGLIPTYTDEEADRMRELIKNAEQQIEEIERNFTVQRSRK